MREIKFRAWLDTSDYNEWHPDFGKDRMLHWDELNDDELFESLSGNVRGLHIMQFTGLHDCNGVEIYESDVLAKDGNVIGFVEYEAPFFTVSDYDSGDYYHGNDSQYWSWSLFEVIGNVHQHKHLLDGESDSE